MSEIPGHPRRGDGVWINRRVAKKVHSLGIRYTREELEMLERVQANRGREVWDGGKAWQGSPRRSDHALGRLNGSCRGYLSAQTVAAGTVPKGSRPGEFARWEFPRFTTGFRFLPGTRLSPSVGAGGAPIFDDANFGYRRGRSDPRMPAQGVEKRFRRGRSEIVDGDLKDFSGRWNHEKLLTSWPADSGRPSVSLDAGQCSRQEVMQRAGV